MSEEQEYVELNRKTVKDYVLLMLGAPVVKIELDEAQLDLCVDQAQMKVDIRMNRAEWDQVESDIYLSLVQEGALVYGKMILGRIRSKFHGAPNCNPAIPAMDGPALLEEAYGDLERWEDRVNCALPFQPKKYTECDEPKKCSSVEDDQLRNMKDYMIDKLDEFLTYRIPEVVNEELDKRATPDDPKMYEKCSAPKWAVNRAVEADKLVKAFQSVKSAQNEMLDPVKPVWGKQGEWVMHNPIKTVEETGEVKEVIETFGQEAVDEIITGAVKRAKKRCR
jgi:hypothetical protein